MKAADKTITWRTYRPADCAPIMGLFYETIHTVNAADYTERQLEAWAPREMDAAHWDSRLSRGCTVVALLDGVIVGFGTLEHGGYLDLLYVHKQFQRVGVASVIADSIEGLCREKGILHVTTDASITAKPFFEQRGYRVLKKQTVETRGQRFINFKMQKSLCP